MSVRNFVFLRESSPYGDDNSSRIDRERSWEDKNDGRSNGESRTGLRTDQHVPDDEAWSSLSGKPSQFIPTSRLSRRTHDMLESTHARDLTWQWMYSSVSSVCLGQTECILLVAQGESMRRKTKKELPPPFSSSWNFVVWGAGARWYAHVVTRLLRRILCAFVPALSLRLRPNED